MADVLCRACRSLDGDVVLDLGAQPACDYFPLQEDPGPDPVYPLRLWLCGSCGLAQLMDDPTVPEEPRAAEPAALVEQAACAVDRLAAAGWLRPGMRAIEYGSPHGGSWSTPLARWGVSLANEDQHANVVLDCFGLMHCSDQATAIAERASRVAPSGCLLLQYHCFAAILRLGQWNSVRHGHFAYYSTDALARMLSDVGFTVRAAWNFDLYGGTVLVAATRNGDRPVPTAESLPIRIADELRQGVRDPSVVRHLQTIAENSAESLHGWCQAQRASGSVAYGYGAASRAVALLSRASIDSTLLAAVADASAAKHGRRMPGTDIPVVNPQQLVTARPRSVLVFLSDLMSEVRRSIPHIEATGGRWVDVDTLRS